MENELLCSLHNVIMPGKNHPEYGMMYSHIIPAVGFCNGKRIKPFKPQGAAPAVPTPIQPPLTREPLEAPDWDKIAEGKVRHGVVVAMIEHGGIEALKGKLPAIKKITEYIMTGEYLEEVN